MAYTSGFSAVTGAVFTAAQYNTNVRDNFTAIWVYTTAGDISYATGATTLARLAIGAAGSLLSSTGTAPAWQTNGRIHTFGYDSTTTTTSTTSTTGVAITGLTLDLTLTATCTILLFINGSTAMSGGSEIQYVNVLGVIDGTTQTKNVVIPESYSTNYEPYAGFYYRTGITAGTRTCSAKLTISDASRTANFIGGSIFALAITE